MPATILPFNPEYARLVKADTLTPLQHTATPAFKTACDFHEQHMNKHPFLSEFHSRAEYLHAGLLEADHSVISYVPQGIRVRLRQRWYTADCYVQRVDQRPQVLELKPRGEMADKDQVPLTHYFAQYGWVFEVISNESVYEREIEAENWLEIVRILHQARDLDTVDAEQRVLERIYQQGPCTLGDLIDSGDRERTYLDEIALFRLLHRGYLTGTLTERDLDYDTGIATCA
ncbi:MAG: hypothetical protein OQL06_00825 [Gammaproteobacteria bacterium]|nr:hypothetical protein [Gammaproteobacteria bacterium]